MIAVVLLFVLGLLGPSTEEVICRNALSYCVLEPTKLAPNLISWKCGTKKGGPYDTCSGYQLATNLASQAFALFTGTCNSTEYPEMTGDFEMKCECNDVGCACLGTSGKCVSSASTAAILPKWGEEYTNSGSSCCEKS